MVFFSLSDNRCGCGAGSFGLHLPLLLVGAHVVFLLFVGVNEAERQLLLSSSSVIHFHVLFVCCECDVIL